MTEPSKATAKLLTLGALYTLGSITVVAACAACGFGLLVLPFTLLYAADVLSSDAINQLVFYCLAIGGATGGWQGVRICRRLSTWIYRRRLAKARPHSITVEATIKSAHRELMPTARGRGSTSTSVYHLTYEWTDPTDGKPRLSTRRYRFSDPKLRKSFETALEGTTHQILTKPGQPAAEALPDLPYGPSFTTLW